MTRTALLSVLILSGCYASNLRDERDIDGGVPPTDATDAASGLDAPLRDARVGDAGRDAAPIVDAACVRNTEDRVVLACVLSPAGVLPPMRETRLSLDRSTCVCASQRSCSVRAEGDILRVETRSCVADEDCDSCDFDQTCTVPPLMPGSYRLVVDGIEVYTLQVGGESPLGPRCYRMPAAYSTVPDDFCEAPRVVDDLSRACFRRLEDVGARATITLTSGCLDCNLWTGGCEARVEGSRIVLSPRLTDCTCTMAGCAGACEACTTHEVVCTTPALRAGDYTVEASGRGVFAGIQVDDVVAPGPVFCMDLAP